MNSPQQGLWQGTPALQALAALAAPASHLRRQILSSMQRLVPAMLAASIGNERNQQMVVAMLHVICHKLAPFGDKETEAAGYLGLHLLTGTWQLTTVHSVSTSMSNSQCQKHSLRVACSCITVNHCGGTQHVWMSAVPVAVKHRLPQVMSKSAISKAVEGSFWPCLTASSHYTAD